MKKVRSLEPALNLKSQIRPRQTQKKHQGKVLSFLCMVELNWWYIGRVKLGTIFS